LSELSNAYHCASEFQAESVCLLPKEGHVTSAFALLRRDKPRAPFLVCERAAGRGLPALPKFERELFVIVFKTGRRSAASLPGPCAWAQKGYTHHQ